MRWRQTAHLEEVEDVPMDNANVQTSSGRGGRATLAKLRQVGPTGAWPALFTLGNLVVGFAAIHFATKPASIAADPSTYVGPWGWSTLTMAASLVLLGILLDSVDGSVARLTDSVTELGGQLDSLSDLVTFGVAPAFIMLNLLSQYIAGTEGMPMVGPDTGLALGKLCWGVAAIFVCCAALRLARFNVETASGQLGDHMVFRGLPTPGAAGAVVGPVLLHEHLLALQVGDPSSILGVLAGAMVLLLPLVALLAAIMMVSNVPYRHLANRYLRVSVSFPYLVGVAAILCVAIWWLQETLAIVFLWYLLSGPAGIFKHRLSAEGQEEAA
ncbi:MAG: CDP-alcohol phosphatidyltransferase family protein [Phycisphaerales bacterium]|nr:CDP-alcohol phosphatidyltransferase family protein [Phycisphaerales bacterium]